MQFHVLVHCVDGDATTAKLKALLASIRITEDLLHRAGPDKPLLIKRPFSQAQAVKLRDQLLRLGFESSILPQSRLQKPQAQPQTQKAQKSAEKRGNSSSPEIARIEQQIQALFKAPAKGIGETTFSSLSSWLLALRILASPLADILLLLLTCLLPPLAAAWVMVMLAEFSFLLGLLSFPIFLGASICSAALLAFFLWPRQPQPWPQLTLDTKADPRLLLFASKVSQLVSAPAPTTISLTMEGRPHLSAGDKIKSLHLELPLPLVYTLSLAELASLLAGEAARFSGNQLPSLKLIEKLRARLRRYATSMLDLSKLEQLQSDLKSAAAADILRRASTTLRLAEKRRAARSHRHLLRTDRLLANSGVSRRVGELFWGASTRGLEKKVNDLNLGIARHSEQVNREPGGLLVDLVGAAVAAAHDAAPSAPEGAIVRGDHPTRVLIKHLEQYDRALSRLFYESQGFDLKYFQLLSREEITRQQQLDEKLRQIASRYFAGWHQPRQFWQLPAKDADAPVSNTANAVQQLNRCITQLRRLAPERNELLVRQERLKQQLAELRAGRKVIASGGDFKFSYFPAASPETLPSRETLEARLRECSEELFHQNGIMGERLNLGLLLAQKRGLETAAIIEALTCLGKMRSKVEQLQLELNELRLLTASQSAVANVSLSVHQRELSRSLDACYGHLARQLQRCPYHFCDPATANLGHLLQLRIQQRRPYHISDKAELLLEVIDEAHQKISSRAAGIAAQIEHHYQVEKIRRLDAALA